MIMANSKMSFEVLLPRLQLSLLSGRACFLSCPSPSVLMGLKENPRFWIINY